MVLNKCRNCFFDKHLAKYYGTTFVLFVLNKNIYNFTSEKKYSRKQIKNKKIL